MDVDVWMCACWCVWVGGVWVWVFENILFLTEQVHMVISITQLFHTTVIHLSSHKTSIGEQSVIPLYHLRRHVSCKREEKVQSNFMYGRCGCRCRKDDFVCMKQGVYLSLSVPNNSQVHGIKRAKWKWKRMGNTNRCTFCQWRI